MNRAWFRLTVFAASLTLLATGLIAGSPVAEASNHVISSSGPLTNIWISDTLGCQVSYQGDTSYEWYSPSSQEDSANCGTRLAVPSGNSAIVFGPASNYYKDQAWTPVSQSAVTGTGTSSDPYTIVTVVKAVDSNGPTDLGIQLTQTDSYVVGEASYRTDVRIDNTSGSALDGVLYRLGDCYLQGSDSGYGIHDATSGAVGCRKSQDADARVEEWVPITSGSHYYESGYSNVVGWPTGTYPNASNRGTNFPDTSDDNTTQDNGTGISWSVTIANGGHATFSELSAFSPTGNVPLSTDKTADSDTAAPGAQDGYTITVHNPNNSDVTLNDITDNLPNGFSYVDGSTTDGNNNAVADPSNDGNDNLTWSQDGGFTVPQGGDFSLHFDVTVSNTTGNYNNQAGADAAGGYSVAPSGPTATVQVASSEGSIDADLGITKSDAAPYGPDPVTAGNDVSYLLTVTNNGPDDSTGVAVADDVPGGTSFVSASGDGWACDYDSESNTVFCHRDSLANGDSATITVVFKTADPGPACPSGEGFNSCITNTASVDFYGPGDQFDGNPDNNTAHEQTDIQPKPQNPDQSTGYVPPGGGTVTTGNNPNATDNTDATVKLPPGPGGVVNIEEMTPPPDLCVNGCTGQAVEIDIPDGYTNPDAPAKTTLKYDQTVVRPRGGAKIYIKKGSNAPFLAPNCLAHGVANPSPCVGSRQRLANGDLRVTVLLLSGDPLCGKH